MKPDGFLKGIIRRPDHKVKVETSWLIIAVEGEELSVYSLEKSQAA